MRVGIFGGSFNPPHVAHRILAEWVRDAEGLDRVLWIPNGRPPHKAAHTLAEARHRLAMTRLATEGHDAFAVSSYEVERAGRSYTVETVAHLQATHPQAAFVLLIGGDSLRDFHTWRDPDEIVRRVPLVVYRRPGDESETAAFAAHARFVEAPLLELSADVIRARRRAGRSIRYLVPRPVHDYIERHGLYLPPS